ncbi:MAG: DinB family protein, partial [Verrucomicrobiota bacterium]
MNTPADLLAELDQIDRRMRLLIDDLSDEQLAVPFEPGINPPIWELGHSAFFFEYFLLRHHYNQDPIDPELDDMWDSFVIPHRERWTPGVVPNKDKPLSYYDRVFSETRERLDHPDLSDEELYLGQYVIAHQCMHIESLVWCRQTSAWQPPAFIGEGACQFRVEPSLPSAVNSSEKWSLGVQRAAMRAEMSRSSPT